MCFINVIQFFTALCVYVFNDLRALGQGILSTTRECPVTADVPSPLLDSSYRARQYAREVKQVQQWYEEELALATPKERGSAKAKANAAPAGVAAFLAKVRAWPLVELLGILRS